MFILYLCICVKPSESGKVHPANKAHKNADISGGGVAGGGGRYFAAVVPCDLSSLYM